MYFRSMPNIYYDFPDKNGQPTLKILKDITTNVRIIQEVLENVTVYDYYDILDGETMEIISTKVYGTPNYHWLLMLLNDIYDYRNDMPMTFTQLDDYISKKYNNKFTFTSTEWSYTQNEAETVSTVTIQIPNHGLPYGTSIIVEGATAGSNPPNGSFVVSDADVNAISFTTTNIIHGTPGGTLTIYATITQNAIHHFVNAAGFTINSDDPGAEAVTNYDYEVSVNESKRRIKLVSKNVLDTLAKQYSQMF